MDDFFFTVFQTIWVWGILGPPMEAILAKQNKIVFLGDFALQNKVETALPDGLETSGQRAYC